MISKSAAYALSMQMTLSVSCWDVAGSPNKSNRRGRNWCELNRMGKCFFFLLRTWESWDAHHYTGRNPYVVIYEVRNNSENTLEI